MDGKLKKISNACVSIAAFSAAATLTLLLQCWLPRESECYLHPMASLYLPVMLTVPGLLIFLVVAPVRRFAPDNPVYKFITLLCAHTVVGVSGLKSYLAVTGSDWSYLPKWETDGFFIVGATAMSLVSSAWPGRSDGSEEVSPNGLGKGES